MNIEDSNKEKKMYIFKNFINFLENMVKKILDADMK